jgi:hypothetical protein
MSLGAKVFVHPRRRNGITAAHTHVISGRPVGRRIGRRAKPSRSADCLVLRTSVQIRQLKPAMAPGFSPSDRSTEFFSAYDRVVNKSKTVWIWIAAGAADLFGLRARKRKAMPPTTLSNRNLLFHLAELAQSAHAEGALVKGRSVHCSGICDR